MMIHARLFLLLSVLVFLLSTSSAFAQLGGSGSVISPATPSSEIAIELLALRDERIKKDYEVALIMGGEAEFQGLTVANAATVTFFGPTLEDGNKKRELSQELFLWNADYGWFLCEFGQRLGRTTVFIWSERKGIVEID